MQPFPDFCCFPPAGASGPPTPHPPRTKISWPSLLRPAMPWAGKRAGVGALGQGKARLQCRGLVRALHQALIRTRHFTWLSTKSQVFKSGNETRYPTRVNANVDTRKCLPQHTIYKTMSKHWRHYLENQLNRQIGNLGSQIQYLSFLYASQVENQVEYKVESLY